jgi:hypothetical protein
MILQQESSLPNAPRFGLGRSFIHLAALLIGLNLVGAVALGFPLTLVPALACLWVAGIIIHIVEPGKRKANR